MYSKYKFFEKKNPVDQDILNNKITDIETLKELWSKTSQQNENIFIEWEMTITFKKNPNSVLCGTSRVTLNEKGRIIEQRDFYDL